MSVLYFDHAASTPPYEEVIQTVAEVMRTYYGNPSSLHHAGASAEKLVKQASSVIASAWDIDPDCLIYTSGGSESNNMAIFGVVRAFSNRGKHLITSRIEHPSVYECFRMLEHEGYEVTYLEPDESGAVRASDVEAALRDDTILVSVMHVNNETGRIQPIHQIGQLLASRPKTLFHVDAVQAAGKLPLGPAALGVDLMSVSAHKLNGPRGIGLLYVRRGLRIAPFVYGGGQQYGLRSGTENVPLIVGMAKAIRMNKDKQHESSEHLYRLRAKLCDQLLDIGKQVVLTGGTTRYDMAPHIVHFRTPGLRAEVFLHELERRGCLVSSQSACSSGANTPSRVLQAMGLSDEEASCGVRISMSSEQTEHDIAILADAIRQTITQLWQWME